MGDWLGNFAMWAVIAIVFLSLMQACQEMLR